MLEKFYKKHRKFYKSRKISFEQKKSLKYSLILTKENEKLLIF